MNLIEKLGLEKCKAIVDGASNSHDETHFCPDVDSYTDGFDEYGACSYCIPIEDLRTAIANHTDNLSHFDHCSDIRNHLSPNTVVVDHE